MKLNNGKIFLNERKRLTCISNYLYNEKAFESKLLSKAYLLMLPELDLNQRPSD